MNNSPTLRYGTPEEAGMLPKRIERVKQLAAGWVAEGHTPSLVILAARKGIIFLHEAYGRLRPDENSPPLRTDSIFPISSNTKPVTATAIMILVEDGLLGLNRPVVDYIPEIRGEGTEEILVHHLLTHTSGYNDEALLAFMIERRGKWPEFPPCPENQHPLIHELLNRQYTAPLWKAPGTFMSYCNHNYFLLGEIVRRVSKCSLSDFAAERIFKPLGMIDTFYTIPESLDVRIVKRPTGAFGGQRISRFNEGLNSRQLQETPYGEAGIFSTAKDMAVFGQMFLNEGRYGDKRVISRPTVSEMTRNQNPGIGGDFFGTYFPDASWGYGWGIACDRTWKYNIGSLHSRKSFGHIGAGGTRFLIDPGQQLVLIYFSVVKEITLLNEQKTNSDLYENSMHAAIDE
jgi:CubicO group peptidase (beta-lactamase class C family)